MNMDKTEQCLKKAKHLGRQLHKHNFIPSITDTPVITITLTLSTWHRHVAEPCYLMPLKVGPVLILTLDWVCTPSAILTYCENGKPEGTQQE